MTALALRAQKIFDGERWHEAAALLLRDGAIDGMLAPRDVPPSFELVDLEDAMLAHYLEQAAPGSGQFRGDYARLGAQRLAPAGPCIATWRAP